MKYKPGDLAWAKLSEGVSHVNGYISKNKIWKLVILDSLSPDASSIDVVFKYPMDHTLYWTTPFPVGWLRPIKLSKSKEEAIRRIFKMYGLMKDSEGCRWLLRRIGVI